MANPDILITPGQGTIGFSGTNTGTIQLRVAESGDIHFEGDQGSLLSLSDDLSDSLFSVNDAAGMPVFEVFADDTIKAYRNNEAKLEIDPDNNRIRLRDNLLVSGDLTVSGDITSASASHEATSYTASTHVSGLSGYFGKVGIGTTTHGAEEAELFIQNIGDSAANAMIESAGGRRLRLSAHDATNYIHVGSDTNHDFHLVRNDTVMLALGTASTIIKDGGGSNQVLTVKDGKLGVMEATPEATLQVDGDASITGELRTDASAAIGGTTPNKGSWTNALTIEGSSSSALELTKSNTLYAFFGVQGAGSSHQLDVAAYQNQNIRFRVGSNAANTALVIGEAGTIRVKDQTVVEGTNSRADIILPDGTGIAIGSAYTFANIYGLGGDLHLRANSYPANLGEESSIYFSTSTAAGGQAGHVVVSGGKVGIATETPSVDLHIGGAFSDPDSDLSNPAIAIKQAGLSAEQGIYLERGGERKGYYMGIAGVDGLHFQRNFAGTKDDVLCLTRAGDVGIGTANPGTLLEVYSSAPSISIKDGGVYGTNATPHLQFTDSNSAIGYVGIIANAGTLDTWSISGDLRFAAGNAVAMQIKTDGDVGIGTANPDTQLDLSQSVDGPLAINIHNQSTNAAADSAISFETQGATDFTIGIDRSLGTFSMCRNATLGTNEIVRIDPAGTISAPTVTIDADVQRVGIGTTNPATILEIESADPILQIRDTESTLASAISKIRIGESDGSDGINNAWDICASGEAAGLNLDFIRTNAGTKNQHGMTLKYDGKVGIGTASPASILHLRDSVIGAGGPTITLEDSSGGTQTATILFDQAGENTLTIATQYPSTAQSMNRIQFAPADNVAMTLRGGGAANGDGFVGIGTANPTGRLHLYQSGDGNPAFLVEGSQGSLFSVEDTLTGSLMSVNDIAGLPVFEAFDDGTVVMGQYNSGDFIVTGNKVGIGTTSPITKIHVQENAADWIATFKNTHSVGYGLQVDCTACTSGPYALAVYAAGGEHLFLRNNGGVGIGTSQPDGSLLRVDGDVGVSGEVSIQYAGGAPNGLRVKGTSNRSKIVVSDNDTSAYMIAEDALASFGRQDHLDPANINISNGGNVGIGTTDPKSTLHVDFTQNGEAIDKGLTIHNTDGGTNDIAPIYFGVHGHSDRRQKAAIGLKRLGSYGRGSLHFAVDSNDDDASVSFANDTKMVIDKDGQVGIGTTVPNGDGLLEVDGNIRLGDGDHRNIIGPTNASLGIYSNPNDANEGVKFSTDGGSTIEMFLEDGGNLGIGPDLDPTEKLHVSGNAIIANAHTSNTHVRIGGGQSSSVNYGGGKYAQEGSTRNSLILGADNGGSCIRMTSQNSSSYEIWADSSALHFDSMNGNRDFYFNSNQTDENIVYITQGEGAVGIGVNPTSLRGSRLAVSGDTSITGVLCVGGNATAESIKLLRNGGGSPYIAWNTSISAREAYIQATTSYFYIVNDNASDIRLMTNNTTNFNLNDAGTITTARRGNVGAYNQRWGQVFANSGSFGTDTVHQHGASGVLHVEKDGSGLIAVNNSVTGNVFEVFGAQGNLLTVTDDLSDSLFSVNDAAGMPVFEIFADDTIKSYRNNESKLEIDPDNNRIRLRDNVSVSGNATISGDIIIPEDKYLYIEGDADDAFNRIGRNSSENALLLTSRFHAGVIIDSNNDDTNADFSIRHNGTTIAGSTSLFNVNAGGTSTFNGDLGVSGQLRTNSSSAGALIVAGGGDNARFGDTSNGVVIAHDSNFGYIQGTDIGGSAYNDLRFRTSANYALTINTSNNVGIGTTSPGSLLEIYEDNSSAGNTQLHIHNDKPDDAAVIKLEGRRASTNDCAQVLFANGGNNVAAIRAFSADQDGELQFNISAPGTADTYVEAMRIDSTGQVGIGTANPGTLLHVHGADPQIRVSDSAGSNKFIDIRSNNGNAEFVSRDNAAHGNFKFITEASSTELTRMTIASDGKVGIGTTSVSGRLHILDPHDGGASLSTAIRLGRRNGNHTNEFELKTLHDGSDEVDAIAFFFGNHESVRFNDANATSKAVIDIGSNNLDLDLIRVTSNATGPKATDYYGGSLRYVGSRSDDGNSLSFFMHQAAAEQAKEMFSISQYGNVLVGEGVGTNQGALFTVSGDAQVSGHIRAGAHGKDGMRMGHWEPADGYGYLQNEALSTSDQNHYAVLQSNNGTTYINANDGRTLFLRVGNDDDYDSEITASGVLWNRGGLPNADFAIKGDNNNVFKVDAGDEYVDLQTAKLKIAGTGNVGKYLKSMHSTNGSVSYEPVNWEDLPTIDSLAAI